MKTSHDKLHRDLAFQVGDWVWLRLHQRSIVCITEPSRSKLSARFYGPFQITQRVGSQAYHLRLPPKARIHDVFHVVFLKKHHGESPAALGSLPPIARGRAMPVPAKVLRAMPTVDSWKLPVQWEGRVAAEARGQAFLPGVAREVLWTTSLATYTRRNKAKVSTTN